MIRSPDQEVGEVENLQVSDKICHLGKVSCSQAPGK